MNCTFVKRDDGDCVCTRCGRVSRGSVHDCYKHWARCGDGVPEKPRDVMANPCKHFLGATGGEIEVSESCGCASAGKLVTACGCELHEICTLISLAADPAVRCCERRCDDYSGRHG